MPKNVDSTAARASWAAVFAFISRPMGGRLSPDVFGKQFHIASPIQDQFGVIMPSLLH